MMSATPEIQRVIGIDPGSQTTGYGVIGLDRGRICFISCGVIKTSGKLCFADRLNQIFDGINEVIQVHEPTVAAVEDVFLATNPRSALKLGQARGAAVVAARQNGLRVYDYSPRMIKQGVAGYGQASKTQMQHMVRVLLGLSGSPSSDAADALAVAICHANRLHL